MIDKRLTEEEKKKIKPVNQAGGPNYLGKQEMVTVPKKWLSDPDHVVAELAYITPREQKILLDANIYGSLKGKPNKGPGGIMSLQGDLGGYDASPGGPNENQGTGGNRVGEADKNKQRAADIMTGRVNVSSPTGITEGYTGPTGVQVGGIGDFVGSKYVGPSLFNPGGYRDVYTKGPKIGQVKPGYLGRILGGIGSMITGIPFVGPLIGRAYDYGQGIFANTPPDMSAYNQLSLTAPIDQKAYIPEGMDPSMVISDPFNQDFNYGITGLDEEALQAYTDYMETTPDDPISFEEFVEITGRN